MSCESTDTGAVLVSACLLGVDCTYRGGNEDDPELRDALRTRTVIAVCPEVEGGLGTPRPRAEVQGGDGHAVLDGRARVRTENGLDVTDAFLRGAHRALATARRYDCGLAILKEASPSCGCRGIYDGSHSGRLLSAGVGVTAALLRREGVHVVGESEARVLLVRG